MATDHYTPTYARPGLGDPPAGWSIEGDERPLGDVIGDLSHHAQSLVRGEIELAKAEVSEKVKSMVPLVAMAAGGVVLGLAAVIFLGHTVAQLIDLVTPTWVAYLLTTVLFLGAAAALLATAKRGVDKADGVAPTKSIASAKEDLSWVKTHR